MPVKRNVLIDLIHMVLDVLMKKMKIKRLQVIQF